MDDLLKTAAESAKPAATGGLLTLLLMMWRRLSATRDLKKGLADVQRVQASQALVLAKIPTREEVSELIDKLVEEIREERKSTDGKFRDVHLRVDELYRSKG